MLKKFVRCELVHFYVKKGFLDRTQKILANRQNKTSKNNLKQENR